MKRDLERLREGRFDLLVIGGGITGAGAALDAAARGLRVALVDKGDFASGTSSVSSKLIHGGLRYLEHGGIRLVREALHERGRLLRNAPHLVRPLRFIVPVYRTSRTPRWKLRLGLTAYDLLAGSENTGRPVGRSRPLSMRELGRQLPQLRGNDLLGGAEYFDAQMDDARLCIEVVKTAATYGACAANYAEVIGFERTGERITEARVLDRVGGVALTVHARQVLNAAGPWIDQVCRLTGESTAARLRPTKGVHLILPDMGLRAALLLLHPRDGRVFFVIPWFGRTLVGTTDTFSDESPDKLSVTVEDVRYLLEGYNHFFDLPLDESAVINTFAGLRPLLAGRPGEPSALSREFALVHSPGGMLSVAGGKYTTYRRMAEVAVDEVQRLLGRRFHRRRVTADLRLDGAPVGDWHEFRQAMAARLAAEIDLDPITILHLIDRYGQRAADLVAYLRHDSKLADAVLPGEPEIGAELAYQRDHEMAVFPADHLVRRTHLGLFHPRLLA